MKNILVIGSLNVDMVTKVHKTPKIGETVSGGSFLVNYGGKGANQAVAMGKLGASVRMIGKVGNDNYGVELKRNLAQMNVIDNVEITLKAPTGTAFIMLNDDGDNSIVVIEGANGELYPEEVRAEWFQDVDFVVLQNEIKAETVNCIIETASNLGKKIVLNLAPARNIEEHILKRIDYLVVNETEFEFISGITYSTDEDIVKAYNKLGVGSILITLGSKGAKFYDGKEVSYSKAEKVDVVDTTAGGDSFIGGFTYKLSLGATVEECLAFANKVAGYTVTKFGAQNALPYIHDIK